LPRLLDLVERGVDGVPSGIDPGVVDQDVEAAELVVDVARERVDAGLVGDVELVRADVEALLRERARRFVAARGVPRARDDGHPAPRETLGDGQPDAPVGAAHDRYLAVARHRRRGADLNRCTRLCRPLPNLSATAPEADIVFGTRKAPGATGDTACGWPSAGCARSLAAPMDGSGPVAPGNLLGTRAVCDPILARSRKRFVGRR